MPGAGSSEMRIELRGQGAIVSVLFERPRVLNAFAPDDLPRLAAAIREAGATSSVRVVVRGEGGSFSSGDDLHATSRLDTAGWLAVVEGFHDLTRAARGVEVPVICAIDGVCIGGAFEFACSCDLRVATTRSRFGCPEVGVGITISNAGSFLIAQLAGVGYASELVLTGRLIDAPEAKEHGLVNRVVEADELDAAIRELAADIARRAPLAVRASKCLLLDAQAAAVEQAMSRETAAALSLFGTADVREALEAFRAKRPASFTGA